MHLEILVEEPSAEVALNSLVLKILGPDCTYRVHPHQGKQDLLGKLPVRMRGYSRWLPEDWRIVVLLDSDGRDCIEEKRQVEEIVRQSGLLTKTAARGQSPFQVVSRLAIEELEAWFFGDVEALHAAYPRVPLSLGQRAGYRDPDRIAHTWENLERVLQKAGYHQGGLSKIQAARDISAHMEPSRNRSGSFQAFREGVLAARE